MATFTELCLENVKKFNDPKVLYELKGPLEYIKDIVIQYNKLGFLTHTSQPGSICPNYKVYQTRDDDRYRREDKILTLDGVRKQRAYIRGFMHKTMADYIILNLKDDHLIVRSTHNSNIVPDLDIQLGSVCFINDEPMAKTMAIYGWSPGACESFDFGCPLHWGYQELYKNALPNDDIVEFDILETEWNDNSRLWTKLLSCLEDYHKNLC